MADDLWGYIFHTTKINFLINIFIKKNGAEKLTSFISNCHAGYQYMILLDPITNPCHDNNEWHYLWL